MAISRWPGMSHRATAGDAGRDRRHAGARARRARPGTPPYWWTARWGSAATPGTARCLSRGPVDRARPGPASPRCGGRSAGSVRRPGHPGRGGLRRAAEVLARLGRTRVQGILLDLGLSSLQIDDAESRFRVRVDAPLDMRMEAARTLTAAEVVNTYSRADLARILRSTARSGSPTGSPAGSSPSANGSRSAPPAAWSGCLPTRCRRPRSEDGGHPAKRTFQALRIEVNEELAALESVLPQCGRRPGHRRPDRRAGLPLTGGPAGQAGADRRVSTTGRRVTCRWCLLVSGPSCGC